ncbi:MAG: hypothetical protein H6662_02865 [Ardenticatenaceae bacterium]|nr:hypothetical protein [Ardenticatenaceae bacterium]
MASMVSFSMRPLYTGKMWCAALVAAIGNKAWTVESAIVCAIWVAEQNKKRRIDLEADQNDYTAILLLLNSPTSELSRRGELSRPLFRGRPIGGDRRPALIIANVINHQGDVNVPASLLTLAAAARRRCQIQKRTISRILTAAGLNAPYKHRNSFGKTYGEHKRAWSWRKEACMS